VLRTRFADFTRKDSQVKLLFKYSIHTVTVEDKFSVMTFGWGKLRIHKTIHIFAQSNDCGARETAVATEWLWTTYISRQRLGKHVPAATDKHSTIKVLLKTVFSTQSVQRGYKEDKWGLRVSSVLESMKKRAQLEGFRRETEDWSLLETATRQLLVKTLRASKDLACVTVICKLSRSALAV
jgi:hypothetical protein